MVATTPGLPLPERLSVSWERPRRVLRVAAMMIIMATPMVTISPMAMAACSAARPWWPAPGAHNDYGLRARRNRVTEMASYRHTCKRGNAGQKRRVALDKVEKVRGDAEQSCIRLILRNLDAKDRGPIHPAECLEIAPSRESLRSRQCQFLWLSPPLHPPFSVL